MEALGTKTRSESELDVPFTIGELNRAIAKTENSVPGKDGICYIMIKHEGGLNKLLSLYNKVWKEERDPVGWKEATIIPIRKPGKYRPIALTSHICKLMSPVTRQGSVGEHQTV